LRDISFNDGVITAKGAIYTAHQALLNALLPHLAASGLIIPGPPLPVQPVMVLTAKQPVINGNFIAANFSAFDYTNPADPEFTASVTETDTWPGLTPDTVQQVLGSASSGSGIGASPGLVFVPGAAPASTAYPADGTYPLADAGGTAEVTVPLDSGGGDAFTLRARAPGTDGELTSVQVIHEDPAASTFTLIATWNKQPAAKIQASDMATEFAYELDVAPPPGATAVAAPAPSSVVLSGGANAAPAQKASATLSG
jgi:hypothetical protein